MPITLTLTPSRGGGERQTRSLSQGTLSIGRGSGNDWVLADPDQHLSRTHCMIASENGRYVMTDLSTNGMLVNGAREPTTRNSRIVLTDGDTIQLGNYVLAIAETQADAGNGGAGANPFGAPFGSGRAAARNPFVQADPFASSSGGSVGGSGMGGDNPLDVDPLDDPLGNPLAAPGSSGFDHPLPHVPRATPRGEDPFDRADRDDRRAGARSLDDLPDASDDSLFRGISGANPWTGPAQGDTADGHRQAFTAPKPIGSNPVAPASGNASQPSPPNSFDDIDFDALLGDVMPTAAPNPLAPPPPQAAPDPSAASSSFAASIDDLLGDEPLSPAPDVVALAPAATAPAPPPVSSPPVSSPPVSSPPVSSPPVSPPAVAAVPAAASSSDGRALIAAFLEGAGLPRLDLSARPPEEAMREIGALFRGFVEGTRDVLMSRAEVKHELRVEQTMLRARDNNALKFSVSPEEALAALLQPGRPGYKPPQEAVREAFGDIRSHEMAVMAGLQTALIALLKRFDPAALEGRLQKGMLDGILPGARKARFWELFCATYKDIAREAEDDFHSIFGAEFARAYDAQIQAQSHAQSPAPSTG